VVLFALLLVSLSDAILSDWVPSFLEKSGGGALFMGIVMSSSSMVGLLADLVLPSKLKRYGAGKILLWAMAMNIVFCGVLWWATGWPGWWLLVIAMAVWGIYYEFLMFGSYQWVSSSVAREDRSGSWGLLATGKSFAYFLGPLLGGAIGLAVGDRGILVVAAVLGVAAAIFWRLFGRVRVRHDDAPAADEAEPFIWKEELRRWWILGSRIWPILTVGLVLGLVDATYWSVGAVWGEKMAQQSWLGIWFLPLYTLPSIAMGLVLAMLHIQNHKKKLADISLMLVGVFMVAMWWADSMWMLLGLSLMVGLTTAVAFPMTEAVYSDVIARMGHEKKHLMGLTSSMGSLAYIIGPITAGLLSSKWREGGAMAVVGVMALVLGAWLLAVTPKKLKLPQKEIKEWER